MLIASSFQTGGFTVNTDEVKTDDCRKSKRSKKFNYYTSIPPLFESISKVPLEGTCQVCREKLHPDFVENTAFLIHALQHADDYDKQACPRCFRHYKLYKVAWPERRASTSLRTVACISIETAELKKLPQEEDIGPLYAQYGSKIPGQAIINCKDISYI